jgi:hypothetical protein
MNDRIEPMDISTKQGLHLLWEDDGEILGGTRYAEVSGSLECGGQLADIYLILLHDGDSIPRHEEGMSLRLMRPYWHGEAFKLVKWIDPDLSNSKLYFWDPQGVGCDLRQLRVTVWQRS